MIEQMIVDAVREENKNLIAQVEVMMKRAVDSVGKAYARRYMPAVVPLREACDKLECTKSELTGRMNAAGITPKKHGGIWAITREEFITLMPEVEI